MKLILTNLLFLAISLFSANLYAQKVIDPIYATTSIIIGFKDGIRKNTATGFFFSDNQKQLYVVTNKHVIYGKEFYKNPEPKIDQIKLHLHTNPNNLSQNEELTVDLINGKNKKWLEHKTKPFVDVILIPVEINRKKYFLTSLNESYIDSSNIQIGFEKIFVMGYPYGWYDTVNNLPVTRIGHLASPFKVPFRGRPIMLGDVETHKGMSGGPVLMKVEDYTTVDGNKRIKHLGSSKTILVGIHSGQPIWDLIDLKTNTVIDTIGHSLINVWFSDLIIDILELNHNSTSNKSLTN